MYLPINLNIDRQSLLIVGGGKVALHKLESLERFTRNIHVVAPEICEGIRRRAWVTLHERPYRPGDLDGHLLVYAATSVRSVNQQVVSDAAGRPTLVTVADAPAEGDFISPAIYLQDNMSVAVSSNGTDVKASVRWRNALQAYLQNTTL